MTDWPSFKLLVCLAEQLVIHATSQVWPVVSLTIAAGAVT